MTDLTQAKPSAPALVANSLGSTPARRVTAENRVPMSLPNAKLAVPAMDGYYLYWHLGKNVGAALRAGYTHVQDDELDIEQRNVATAAGESGSTDMGSNVSVAGGGVDEQSQPERLYLMKLPMEWHEKDVEAHTAINENIARSLRAGTVGAEKDLDVAKRYMKAGQDLFYPKARRP